MSNIRQWAVPSQDADEAALVAGLEQVERLADEREWEAARAALDALIEEHRGLRYGFVHLPALQHALAAVAFGAQYLEAVFHR